MFQTAHRTTSKKPFTGNFPGRIFSFISFNSRSSAMYLDYRVLECHLENTHWSTKSYSKQIIKIVSGKQNSFNFIVLLRLLMTLPMKLWGHLEAQNWPRVCLVSTVYPMKYAHGFVVLCFVVVMQSFIMNSHEVFIHIHQGCFSGTGAIVRLPQCQWSKPDGYGKISQCITTTKHSKAKTVCIFLGIYCMEVGT